MGRDALGLISPGASKSLILSRGERLAIEKYGVLIKVRAAIVNRPEADNFQYYQ